MNHRWERQERSGFHYAIEVLGSDPLFPLPTDRVLRLIRYSWNNASAMVALDTNMSRVEIQEMILEVERCGLE